MAIEQISKQVLAKMWRKGSPHALLVGMQTGAVTVESSIYLKKLKMDLPVDLATPLWGIYPKEPRTLTRKHTSTPMFIAVLFTIAKIWKRPKCPSMGEWIKSCGTFT